MVSHVFMFLQNQICSCFAKNDRNTNTKGPPSFSLASKSQRGSSLGIYDKVRGCAIHFIKKVDSESQLPRTEQSRTEPRKQNAHALFVHPAFRWSVYSNASRGKTRARDFKSGEPRPCCKCHKQCMYIYICRPGKINIYICTERKQKKQQILSIWYIGSLKNLLDTRLKATRLKALRILPSERPNPSSV